MLGVTMGELDGRHGPSTVKMVQTEETVGLGRVQSGWFRKCVGPEPDPPTPLFRVEP
jgi:hypothetical protein